MMDIREATQKDIGLLYTLYERAGKSDPGYFEEAMARGCVIYIAVWEGRPCGFCLLNPSPRYSLFARLSIPEIQDINVLPCFRRRGIATALIKTCEGAARANGCDHIGISVGLTSDYGGAQILYARLGFIPDGGGVTYDREGVDKSRAYPADDNLCLMLVKPL